MSKTTDILQQTKIVEKFLEEYGHLYDERERDYLKRNWQYHLNSRFNMDILRQMYSELGLVEEKDNIYVGFLKILEENFDCNRDIIEVGGGRIPSLAKLIALKQKKGTITVYDPRLLTTKSPYPNMVLKKEKFTKDTSVREDQLVIAFMPCEATEPAVLAATKNKADFVIGLCEGGPHGDEYDYFESEDEWLSSILYTARTQVEKNGLGELMVTDLKEYNDPYPVIYNKRKKL